VYKLKSVLGYVLVVAFVISSNGVARTLNYIESDEDISNPDRGFYYPYTTLASSFEALDKNDLIARRTTAYTPFQANYTVRSSVALRHYVLDSFVNNDTLSESFLSQVSAWSCVFRTQLVRLQVPAMPALFVRHMEMHQRSAYLRT